MPMWPRLMNAKVRLGLGLAAALLGIASVGCDSGSFVPPPPAELREAVGGTSPSPSAKSAAATPDLLGSATTGVKSIELILRGDIDPEEIENAKAVVRTQAGNRQGPDPDLGARREFGRVREVVDDPQGPGPVGQGSGGRHPQALIVEPANPADPDLARAIQDAQAAKVPVILLGRPLAGQAGSASATAPVVVAPESFAASAKQLVAAAIRNARNAKLIPEAGAILLINTAGDAFLPDRVSAIRDALKAAGITAISELRFAKDSQVLQKFLIEKLKADPKPTLVFSADFAGATASNGAVGEIAQDTALHPGGLHQR